MVGGLILSQAADVYTSPVIYLYLDRLHIGCRRAGTASDAGREDALRGGGLRLAFLQAHRKVPPEHRRESPM